MTIPEASQLVLQAFSIGKGGRGFCPGYGQACKDCRFGQKPRFEIRDFVRSPRVPSHSGLYQQISGEWVAACDHYWSRGISPARGRGST
jgi:hypothetical protein